MDKIAISRGAEVLLEIAIENDKQQLIAKNFCLKVILETFKDLPKVCKGAKNTQQVFDWLQIDQTPESLLGFCALMLNKIDSRIKASTPSNDWSRASDFDHGVFLAAAQTLTMAAQVKNNEEPTLDAAFSRYGMVPAIIFQKSVVENYLGNILQDYFDVCNIRFKNRNLPADTEENLRVQDAFELTEGLFATLGNENEGYEARAIQQALHLILNSYTKQNV